MSDETAIKDDVIRKMLRPPPAARGQYHELLTKIAPDMFRRAAKAIHNINLLVPKVEVHLRTIAQAIEALPEKRMMGVMEHDSGQLGLLVFDATLMDALIEQQTLGEILTTPRVDRPVTDIDISMSEPFQLEMLKQLSKLVEGTERGAGLAGYRVTRIEEDLVRLGLDFEAPIYEVMEAELDLGPNLKTGTVQLWFASGKGVQKSTGQAKADPDLMKKVADAPVDLAVWLPEIRVSVRTIMSLGLDKTIPIDASTLSAVQVKDGKGKDVMNARLGQLNGARAIRLVMPGVVPAVADTAPKLGTPALSDEMEANSAAPDLPKLETSNLPDIDRSQPALPDIDDLDVPSTDLQSLDDLPLPDPAGMDLPGMEKSDFEVPDDLVMPELPS